MKFLDLSAAPRVKINLRHGGLAFRRERGLCLWAIVRDTVDAKVAFNTVADDDRVPAARGLDVEVFDNDIVTDGTLTRGAREARNGVTVDARRVPSEIFEADVANLHTRRVLLAFFG